MLGFELLHGEFIVPGLLFLILGISLIALSRFWPEQQMPFGQAVLTMLHLRRAPSAVTHVQPVETLPIAPAPTIAALAEPEPHPEPEPQPEAAVEPEPAPEIVPEIVPEAIPEVAPVLAEGVTPFTRTITWPSLIDEEAGELSEDERRAVIEGLALVGSAWTADILIRAFEEEAGALRIAAIEALAYNESDAVAATLERAYNSPDVPQRYAAVDGASRRGEIELLQRGIRDTDLTVALAAAYGLYVARRDDLIDKALVERDDARANEIRRVLPLLART